MADRNGGEHGNRGIHASTTGATTIPIQAAARLHDGEVRNADADPGIPMKPQWEFFARMAERFGIPVVILSFVLWWARNDLIQPLLDAHFGFLDKMSAAHERQTDELQKIGSKLDTLIQVHDKQ